MKKHHKILFQGFGIFAVVMGLFTGIHGIPGVFASEDCTTLTSENIGSCCTLNSNNKLDCSNKGITSIDTGAFDNYKEITELNLSGNNLTTINFSEDMQSLGNIKASDNHINDLSFLNHCNKNTLSTLILKNNDISDISEIRKFTKIKILNLADNKISNIDNLTNLHELENLTLSNNSITDIPDLFSTLKSLYIQGNNIKSGENLNKLINLTILDISNNSLRSISGIIHLGNYSTLNLNNNCIDLDDEAETISSFNSRLNNINTNETVFTYDNQRICSDWTGNDVTVVFSGLSHNNCNQDTGYYCIATGNYSTEDSGSNCTSGTSYSFNVDTGSIGEWTIFYHFMSGDSICGSGSYLVQIDKQEPICEIFQTRDYDGSGNGWIISWNEKIYRPIKSSDITLTISGNDTNRGIGEIQTHGYRWGHPYLDSDNNWISNNWTTNTTGISSNGTYTGYVKDKLGNINKTGCTITINNIDDEPPTSSGVCNTNICFSGSINVSCNESEHEIGSGFGGSYMIYTTGIENTLNCKTSQRRGSGIGNTFTSTTYLKIAVCDEAGNMHTGNYIYTRNRAPITTISGYNTESGFNGRWTGNDISVQFNVDEYDNDVCKTGGASTTYYCTYNSGENECDTMNTGTSTTIACDTGNVCQKIIKYYSKNASGFEENVKTGIIWIDKQAPSCNITTDPDSNEYTSGNVVLIANADDGTGIGGITYNWTGENFGADTGYTVSSNSGYTLQVKDALGNRTGCDITVSNIDRDIPTLSIEPASGNDIAKRSRDITITVNDCGNAGLSGSQVAKYYWSDEENCSEDNDTYTLMLGFNNNSGASTISGDIIGGNSNGYKYLCITGGITDRAGNSSESISGGSYLFDNTGPTGTIQISYNGNINYASGTTFTLSLTGQDEYSTVSGMRFSCDNNNWSNIENFSGAKEFKLNEHQEIGCNTGDGEKTIYVQYIDSLGNTGESVSGSIIVDTTAPQCTITQAACTSGDLLITLTGNENLQAPEGWRGDTNKTFFTKYVTGNQELSVQIFDIAGNSSSCTGNITNYDITGAEIEVSNYEVDECSNLEVSVTGTDIGCSTGNLKYFFGSTYQTSNMHTINGNIIGSVGQQTPRTTGRNVKVKDSLGNISETTIPIKINDSSIEITSGELNYEQKVNGKKLLYQNLISEMGVNDGNCGKNTVSKTGAIDCTAGTAVWSGNGIEVRPPKQTEGTGSCTVIFTDDEGNEVTGIVFYEFNTIKPNPANCTPNACFTGNYPVSCTSESGTKIVYTINNEDPTCDSSERTGGNFNSTTTLKVATCNDVNNISDISTYTYIQNTNDPNTTLQGLPDGWTGNNITLNININDGCNGINQKFYYCIDEDDSCIPTLTGGTGIKITCDTGIFCENYIRYYSEDGAGNKENLQSRTIKIDKIPLTCEITGSQICTNSGVSLTLITSKPINSISNWRGITDTGYEWTIDGNQAITTTVTDTHLGQSVTCTANVNNIDKNVPTISVENLYTGMECDDITISPIITDDGGCPGDFVYKRNNTVGTGSYTYTGSDLSGFSINTGSFSVQDAAGNTNSGIINYQWIDVPITGHDFEIDNVGTGKRISWSGKSDASAGSCETIYAQIIRSGDLGQAQIEGLYFTYNANIGAAGQDWYKLKISDGDSDKDIFVTLKGIDNEQPYIIEFTGGFGDICTTNEQTTVNITFNEAVTGVTEITLTGENIRIIDFTGDLNKYSRKVGLSGDGTGKIWLNTGGITDLGRNLLSGGEDILILGYYDNIGPTAPTLIDPGNDSTLTSTHFSLEWNPSEISGCANISQYEIEVCTDSNMSSGCTTYISDTTGKAITKDNSEYYWRVFAVDTNGIRSDTGETPKFTVNSTELACHITESSVCSSGNIILELNLNRTGEIINSGGITWNKVSDTKYTGEIANNMPISGVIAKDNNTDTETICDELIVTKYDSTAPITTLSGYTSEWSAKDINIDFVTVDTGCGNSDITTKYCTGDDCTPDKTGSSTIIECNEGAICETILRYQSIDSAGNEEYIKRVTIQIDKQAPSCNITKSTDEVTNEVIVLSVTGTDGTGAGLDILPYQWSGENWANLTSSIITQNGVYTVYVRDRVGNTGTCTGDVSNIDREPPEAANCDESACFSGDKIISCQENEPETGNYIVYKTGGTNPTCSSTRLTNNSITISNNTTLKVAVCDVAGNISNEINTYQYTLDNVAPTTSISGIPEGWTGSNVNISLTASDQGCDGDINTYYCIYESGSNCLGFTTGTNFTVTCTEGQTCQKIIKYYSVDNLGNQEQTKTSIIKIDKQAPSCNLALDNEGYTSGSVNITLTSEDIGIGGIQTSWTESNTRGNTSQISVSKNGTYTAFVKDNLGNQTRCSITVSNINNTPPVAPTCTSNSCFASSKDIQCNKNDENTGSYIVYTTDRQDPKCGNSTHWNSDLSITGDTILKVATCNSIGNMSNINTYSYTGDKVAPTTTVSGLPNDWTGNDVTIGFSTNSNGCNSRNTTYYCIYDSGSNECTPTTKGTNVSVTCTTGTECIKTIRYYSKDGLGNNENIKSATVKINKKILSCELNYNDVCTNTGILVTLTTNEGISTPTGWTKGNGNTYSKIITQNGDISATIDGSLGRKYTCSTTISNYDNTVPNIQSQNEYTAHECHNISIVITGTDTLCGSGKLTYSRDGIEGARTLTKTWNSSMKVNESKTIELKVEDGVGNQTTTEIKYKWIDDGVTLETGNIKLKRYMPEGDTYSTTANDLITVFGAKEGDCGTGDIHVESGACDGASYTISGSEIIITSIGTGKGMGKCEIKFIDNEGSFATGLLSFSKVEEKLNCLSGWDNKKFLDNSFWSSYSGNNELGHEQLICAIFGSEKGDKTAYNQGWLAETESDICSPVDINVVESQTLPSTLEDNTIYVLNTNSITMSGTTTLKNCTAIVSKTNTTLHSNNKITSGSLIYINGSNVVVENINIDGYNDGNHSHHEMNERGLSTNTNVKNITINNTKIYNNNGIGLNIQSGNNHVLLNNIMSYNNKGHGILIYNGSYTSINNILSFNNNGVGVYLENVASGIVNSIQTINNRKFGIVNNNSGSINKFNKIVSYGDSTEDNDSKIGTAYNISWATVVNPVDKSGKYLIDWSNIATSGSVSPLNDISGYSFGNNVILQVQPKAWSGDTIADIGNYNEWNFIGSQTKKLIGSAKINVKSSNKLTISTESNDSSVKKYSVFGDIERTREKISLGKVVDVILKKGSNNNNIIIQLQGTNNFATHYLVYGSGDSGNTGNSHMGPTRYETGDQYEKQANGFTREMNNAYRFAHTYGITTMNTIQSADMYGPLTRIAMAKMLSNYAINILGIKPDTTKTGCSFVDVSNLMNYDYNYGVTNACQLGIMGQNMPGNKFRPEDTLTRAEFATALSRLLYNTEDGSTFYYIPHLNILKAEGILTNTNPDLEETRGYVMLMLMRYVLKSYE